MNQGQRLPQHEPELFMPLLAEERDPPSVAALGSELQTCPEVALREGETQRTWNLGMGYCLRSFIEFVWFHH